MQNKVVFESDLITVSVDTIGNVYIEHKHDDKNIITVSPLPINGTLIVSATARDSKCVLMPQSYNTMKTLNIG